MNDRSSTRRAVVVATAATSLTVLSACGLGVQSSATGQEAQRAARSVPISLWARNALDKVALDRITPLAEQRYPHLAVDVQIADFQTKLIAALAAGTPPDLSVINRQTALPLIGKSTFVDLQPLVGKDRRTSDELRYFAAAALQAYTVGKSLYAIPTTNESIVVWYNEDLLRQQNLQPPHEFEDDPNRWNWDTLLDYAKKVNRGHDQDRELFGLWAGIRNVQTAWGNLVYSNGGKIISDDGARLMLSDPPATEAIQWAVDTIWRHDVQPQLATTNTTPDQKLFTQGRLALAMEGEFLRQSLYGPQVPQGTPFKYNLAQLPFCPRTKQRAEVFNALGLVSLKQAKATDAAWQYLTVFATKDAQQFITDLWGSRGGHKGTYEPWLKSNAGGGQPANYAAIVKADAYGQPQLASPYLGMAELQEPINRILPQVYNNQLPVRTGLQQIDQETNAKLALAGSPQR